MNLLLGVLVTASLSAAAAPSVGLESRNMPRTCEFVFEVESDIRVRTNLAGEGWQVRYAYNDAYDTARRGLEPGRRHLADGRAEWSLLSFENSRRKLYREVEFYFEQINERGEREARVPALPQVYVATFAREFGEPCQPGGRAVTPWRPRELRSGNSSRLRR